jgi:N-acylneuraminate cytidylyltransferase
MNVAIIPARGGSKRIPRKNIKPFFGKPIIAWSIEAAIASACCESVIVSTDDAEIAEIAMRFGAQVPFVRPKELANDHAGTIPVIRHAVEWLCQNRVMPANVCCIYATAPFVRAEDIRRGLQSLQEQQCNFAFSATSFPYPIQRAIRIDARGYAAMVHPEHFATRSQDLDEMYHDAGQFYWGTASAWMTGASIFDGGAHVVQLPRERVQDIDTIEDWTRAERLFSLLYRGNEA